MAKYLDKNLFEQKLVCTDARGPILEGLDKEGVEVITIGQFKSPFDWKQHKKVQKIIEDYQPNIIHGAVFEGVTMAAINGWIKKVPVIIIEETSFPVNRTWKGNLLMKLFSKLADIVVGVSTAVTEEYLKGKLNLSDKKVVLINNGVALPRLVLREELQEAKEKWGINENDFVIGSTGRMLNDSNKRYSDLIKAFAEFSKGKENVKLLLVGDGPEREGYQRLVKKLGISDKVIFVGYQSDVSLFYGMMDVFALVSAHESFGLVLAEAMLNKLPVIATRVGGMKYIVEDQETGYLIEPKNTEEIKSKLEVLYADADLRNKMGSRGRSKALREYTEENYVQKIQALYIDLIKQKEINQ
ncbi:glycosyltransferase [Chryseobacterium suipulveris]|uniref:Glycosyltransferase n=1 Tax=Chryseobacterium suipulveris TaxID=2929800 RepID=A0ABY4BQP5_9FLAO|nr:glycosyltransferase [Chryseobacterium suipulveris]UOE41524.1 glycosyltransferase [Chryseobacterium suipulveris]